MSPVYNGEDGTLFSLCRSRGVSWTVEAVEQTPALSLSCRITLLPSVLLGPTIL